MPNPKPLPTASDDGALELNLATMIDHTKAEGPGERFALWVQGCAIRCPSCCNPQFFHHRPNKLMTVDEVWSAVQAAKALNPGIEGISFLGGEPFEQDEALAALARRAKGAGLTVMVFTGHLLEDLQTRGSPLLQYVDLMLDGPYVEELRTTKIRWAGSTNQRFHFMTDAYSPGDPRFAEPNHVELKLTEDGEIQLVGFPFDSVLEQFKRGQGEITSTPKPREDRPKRNRRR